MKNLASICVLSYERPGLLRACLESIRDAGAPFELIVHDDGSLNASVTDFLYALQRKGMISSLILQPPGWNEGVGEATRKCFAVAQGDLLIKVDQDLVFEHGWLAQVRDGIRATNAGAAGLFKYFHDPCDFEKQKLECFEGLGIGWWTVEDFVGSAFAIPRELYELSNVGPIESHAASFSEDVGLKERLCKAGYPLILPDEALAMNMGFGVGPERSTVNKAYDDSVVGGVEIQAIKDVPLAFSGEWT